MSIQEITSQKAGDKYYKINHKSGLTIYVYPKAGYSSTYAIFGTKYGSINTTFKDEKGQLTTVPDGIAHYLEHKLFESEDGDAFLKYAKTGASANAYTSFDKTCYLFSCTERFKESMDILLDFVQSPYFTRETVAKEQGIIGQEIRMYDDAPSWRVLFNLLDKMYHNHPVKIDIAGTVESIAEITPEKLYTCYNGFYNLHNMALCVAGNTTVEEVLSIADEKLKDSPQQSMESFVVSEPDHVVSDYVEQKFAVAVPLFQLGFKETPTSQRMSVEKIAQSDILLFILASNSSPLYKELMDNELINGTFEYEHFEGPGYSSVFFGGESRNPKETAQHIRKAVDSLRQGGVSQADFETAKRAMYGDAISSLNRVDTIANMLIDFDFADREIFAYIDAIANTTIEQVNARLLEQLDSTKSTLSVILPLED
ncbi:MAG TPA: insulinase family protein [Clostridiales bacterium]|nr:insulinase family protein [Clostridiales bacterium]